MSWQPKYVSQDGQWAVIEAGEYATVCKPGAARSKTAKTPQGAMVSPVEAALTSPPGPKSVQAKDLIKVHTSNLITPLSMGANATYTLSPANFGGTSAKKSIPDYPHKCPTCGGKMLMLFTSQEHEGGTECPGKQRQGRHSF